MRIVSLLPSATEIICGLGLQNSLVGVTHECDFPSNVVDLPKVTQTLIPHDASSSEIDSLVREKLQSEKALYTLNMEILQQVKPELIVTQALCDVCAVAEHEVNEAACVLPENPEVINLEPNCLEDVFGCIERVAVAAQCEEAANRYIAELRRRVEAVRQRSMLVKSRPTVMLLEWIDPPFSAGHWSPELIELGGGTEVIGVAGQRSVTTCWSDIISADPEMLMIACCGFNVERTLQDLPILRSYTGWKSLRCVRNQRVFVVDGSAYFSRPGPRLVDSLEILANALHPEIHALPNGLPAAIRLSEQQLLS